MKIQGQPTTDFQESCSISLASYLLPLLEALPVRIEFTCPGNTVIKVFPGKRT